MEERNLSTKIDELVTELINKDPLVPAIISTVPIFGSTLATFYSAKWQTISWERIKAMFDKFGKDLSELDEQIIKKDYFDTDEGFDLLIKATEESAKTRSEEKRAIIARVLCSAVVEYEQSTYSAEEYLYLISDLTSQELLVARSVYENRPATYESWNEWQEQTCSSMTIDKVDLHMAVRRLSSVGLLQPITSGIDEKGMALRTPEYGEVAYHYVTEVFDKLMEFLQLRT